MTQYLDAATARAWFNSALAALSQAREGLDALNIFPVPDADTGSNVLRTLAAGARAAAELGEDATLGELARAVADGALWGARGNSGIIMAQSLQAMARTFDSLTRAGPVDMIRAFDAVANAASTAVSLPAEGTIISVAREMAAATLPLGRSATLDEVVATALAAAYTATEATTDQLAVLRGTGRVDSGAVALVILVETLADSLGLPITPHPEWLDVEALNEEEMPGFEVMYLVRATHREATDLRLRLGKVGDSVVVVAGAGQLWHVHVHLDHPADALADQEMSQVCVRRLDAPRRTVAVVAETVAPELLEPLAEAGAVAVLRAGPRTLARAVVDGGSPDVVVLTSSAQAASHAQAAGQDESVLADGVRVTVAPTSDDLTVLDAMLTLPDADADLATVLSAIDDVVAETSTFEILDPQDDRELMDAAERACAGAPGVVSLLVGERVGAADGARRLAEMIAALAPEVETYVIPGGQTAPPLLVAAR